MQQGMVINLTTYGFIYLLERIPNMADWNMFIFTPILGEDSHFDSYFSDGLVQPPSRFPQYIIVTLPETNIFAPENG